MNARACPICDRPSEPAVRPFCSARCRDVDLQRWFSGAYAIPVEAAEEDPSPAADPDAGQAREPPL